MISSFFSPGDVSTSYITNNPLPYVQQQLTSYILTQAQEKERTLGHGGSSLPGGG